MARRCVTTLAAVGILINLSVPHPLPLTLSLVPQQHQPLRPNCGRPGQGADPARQPRWPSPPGRGRSLAPMTSASAVTNPAISCSPRLASGAARILDRDLVPWPRSPWMRMATSPAHIPCRRPRLWWGSPAWSTGRRASRRLRPRLRGDDDTAGWDVVRDGLLHIDADRPRRAADAGFRPTDGRTARGWLDAWVPQSSLTRTPASCWQLPRHLSTPRPPLPRTGRHWHRRKIPPC